MSQSQANYVETIHTLFRLLYQANLADSDSPDRLAWQKPDDAAQRPDKNGNLRFYGAIRAAIVAIAGPEIQEHWAEFFDVKIELANRLEQDNPVEEAYQNSHY